MQIEWLSSSSTTIVLELMDDDRPDFSNAREKRWA